MVPDIHAKFQNQQFIMRRAIKLFLTLFVQNDLKWRTFSITLAKLEPQWPHSEQRSDVIHGSAWGYIKHHLVTDDRSNWKRLLSGAVALSHCIFHSVTTCSTPSRCVPLRHDLVIQKYALTNIHNYVIPWWRTIEATGNACCLVQLHSVTVYSTSSQRVPLRHGVFHSVTT